MRLSRVPENYDKAARTYDCLTDLVFERLLGLAAWRRRTIDLLGSLHGATILDVGCGTGRNFPLLVDRVGRSGRIIGLDYSMGMLRRARDRIRREGWRNVDLIRDDAATLGSLTAPVDAVTAAWSLGIVYDLQGALTRALALLRAGGRLSLMDFCRSRPDRGPLKRLYPVYRCVLQRAGIDSAEDLDNTRLEKKWRRGLDLLDRRLENLHIAHYLYGTGLVVAGRKPLFTDG